MYEYKRLMLISYLKSYLLKYEIRMKWIMNNMARKRYSEYQESLLKIIKQNMNLTWVIGRLRSG